MCIQPTFDSDVVRGSGDASLACQSITYDIFCRFGVDRATLSFFFYVVLHTRCMLDLPYLYVLLLLRSDIEGQITLYYKPLDHRKKLAVVCDSRGWHHRSETYTENIF